ncbi:hypothetical protein [Marinobacterium weihaiense]|uniref:Uncharacterized protein n=1 Tax=Marinobacterium weihaiense TaxID=2851016 RepID=A0ABS6MBC2_9GAMM|nr:hypothetical protein [Marinobacterium weihaiense]MBV0933597.1 hypothetical protein [Marinobacterium weihaiense]
MPINYAAILCEHGFVAESDVLHDSITGFDYEIGDLLYDDDSPFDANMSDIQRQPHNLDALLQCSLTLKPGESVDAGVRFLVDKWQSWLRYENPVYENIERQSCGDGAVLRILAISGHTACSIVFGIKIQTEVLCEQV